MNPQPAEFELTISRLIDAPRSRVFRAWTEPSLLQQWWGPHVMTTPECEMYLWVDGLFRTLMRAPDGSEYPRWVSLHFYWLIRRHRRQADIYRVGRYSSICPSIQLPAGPGGCCRDQSASTATERGQPRTVSSTSPALPKRSTSQRGSAAQPKPS